MHECMAGSAWRCNARLAPTLKSGSNLRSKSGRISAQPARGPARAVAEPMIESWRGAQSEALIEVVCRDFLESSGAASPPRRQRRFRMQMCVLSGEPLCGGEVSLAHVGEGYPFL